MKFGLRHVALIVTTFLALGLNASALLRQPMPANQTTHRAGLVVRFGDGRVEQQCISFTEAEITGYDLLRRSTLPVVANQFGNMGAAICKIAEEGCNYPAEDCFCKSISEQKSWFLWTLQNGVWTSSNAGASSAKVTEDVVHGWVWGSGSPSEPVRTFDQICNGASAITVTATSTSVSTSTPTSTSPPPQPVATAMPTSAPISSDLVGGGQVISGAVGTPAPTAVAPANVSAQPASAPTAGVTVMAVVAVLVPTATPAAPLPTPLPATVAAVPTAAWTSTSTPTFTPEPTLSSTSTSTSTFTFTSTSTSTSTPTFTPEPMLSSTSTSTKAPTLAPEPTSPTPPPPPPEPPSTSNLLGYAVFGVIALGLVGGIALDKDAPVSQIIRPATRWLSVATYVLISVIGLAAFLNPFWLPALAPGGMSGHGQDAPLMTLLLIGLCLVAIFLDAQSNGLTTKTIALLGVLVAINSVLRFIEVTIPGPGGFTPIFFLIILSGYVFGARFGFLMGALTLLVSGLITGGVGPWLPYQMFTAGWMGLSAGWLARVGKQRRRTTDDGRRQDESSVVRRPSSLLPLLIFGALWGFLYGLIINIWFWPFAIGPAAQYWQPGIGLAQTLQRYLVFYVATSAAWDVFGAIGNAVFILLFGLPTLRTLQRFKGRFTFNYQPTTPRDALPAPTRLSEA